MKEVALGIPLKEGDWGWVQRALREIERASQVGVETVADGFTISGTFAETRDFDAESADLAEVRAVLATLLADLKARGAKPRV